MSAEAPEYMVEVVDSPRVEHTRPGLGRKLARAAGAFLFGTPLVLVALLFWNTPREEVLFGIFWAGVAGVLLAAVGSVLSSSMSWPRPRSGVLRASEKGLAIAAEGEAPVVIARDRIESGMVLSGWPHVRLMLQLRNGDVITADAAGEPAAQRVLAILGVSADVRRVSVRLGTANRQILAALITLPLCAIVAAGFILVGSMQWQYRISLDNFEVIFVAFAIMWLLFTAVLTQFVVSTFRPLEVIVGSDGVRFQAVHRHEFSHADIVRCEANDRKLILFLRGSTRTVPYIAARGEPGIVAGLAARIHDAVERAQKSAEEHPIAEILDPAGRSLAAWREALRALVSDAGYRHSGVTPASLLEVLEDPAAPPQRRIGAAIALRGAEHPEAKTRIRVVAEACVDDSMRQALEEAAEGELAERTLRRVLR